MNLILRFQVSWLLATGHGLQVAKGSEGSQGSEMRHNFRYTNIVPFPLSMPLFVLAPPFPPQRGNQDASVFLSGVSSPPFGGDAEGRGGTSSGNISLLGLRFRVYCQPLTAYCQLCLQSEP